jgi:hypothetical protein
MGHGLANAYNFLNAIAGEGAGRPMQFPNVFVSPGALKSYDPSLYLGSSSYTIVVTNAEIATAENKDGRVYIKGLKPGQTKASITNGTDTHEFVITVRESAAGNGWL